MKYNNTFREALKKIREAPDHEISMARGELKATADKALELVAALEGKSDEGNPMEAWVQSKITKAKDYAHIIIGIIGRDKTIIKHQQARVRKGEHTTPQALEQLNKLQDLADTFYVSQELFYLYGKDYLKNICKTINFPIDYNNTYITKLSTNEANEKYIQQTNKGPFDDIQLKINY